MILHGHHWVCLATLQILELLHKGLITEQVLGRWVLGQLVKHLRITEQVANRRGRVIRTHTFLTRTFHISETFLQASVIWTCLQALLVGCNGFIVHSFAVQRTSLASVTLCERGIKGNGFFSIFQSSLPILHASVAGAAVRVQHMHTILLASALGSFDGTRVMLDSRRIVFCGKACVSLRLELCNRHVSSMQ